MLERTALPGLYFYRVPSPSATDDEGTNPPVEEQSSGRAEAEPDSGASAGGVASADGPADASTGTATGDAVADRADGDAQTTVAALDAAAEPHASARLAEANAAPANGTTAKRTATTAGRSKGTQGKPAAARRASNTARKQAPAKPASDTASPKEAPGKPSPAELASAENATSGKSTAKSAQLKPDSSKPDSPKLDSTKPTSSRTAPAEPASPEPAAPAEAQESTAPAQATASTGPVKPSASTGQAQTGPTKTDPTTTGSTQTSPSQSGPAQTSATQTGPTQAASTPAEPLTVRPQPAGPFPIPPLPGGPLPRRPKPPQPLQPLQPSQDGPEARFRVGLPPAAIRTAPSTQTAQSPPAQTQHARTSQADTQIRHAPTPQARTQEPSTRAPWTRDPRARDPQARIPQTWPITAPPSETADPQELQDPQERDKRRISRRAVIQASLIGGAGVAALPLLTLVGDLTRSRPKPIGVVYPLNNYWLFGPYQVGSEAAAFDDSGFVPVTLPHTARKTHVPQTAQGQATQTAQAQATQTSQLSWRNWNPGSWEHVWIYRRYLDSAALLTAGVHLTGDVSKQNPVPGYRVFADFDGVMVNSTVVCNDKVVATHQGGYLPFSAELTGLLTVGKNVLSVIADAHNLPVPPMVEGGTPSTIDFLQPGGIYRDVNLRIVPQVFISDLYAAPADVLTAQPKVTVQCTIDAALVPKSKATLTVELLDLTGANTDIENAPTIASVSGYVHIVQPGLAAASLALTDIGKIQLWSPDTPALYAVRATIDVPGSGAHAATRRIGFREATFKPDGFYLNGQRLQIFGLDRHQLYPYTGMAMPARVQRKDAEIIKNEFNCNMVRCSHYPQSPHFLDACDELGLLVWEEAPGWDRVSTLPVWQDQVIQNVKDMVTRDRSRPSVIIWGTRLNETGNYPGLWAATRQVAKALDPSRPTSGAMDSRDLANWAEDVFAFNDYSFTPATDYATLMPPLPGVPYLVTESVGVVETHPQHFTWTDPPALLAKQAALHAQAHSAAANPGYAGLLGWAGFDYASLRGGRPDNIKWAGVADGFRVPKLGAAIYQSQVDPRIRPVIVPVFFWEPGGPQPSQPAAGLETMIASNCERLEILLDGEHVASALPAAGSPLYQGLRYPPFFVTLPPLLAGTSTPTKIGRGGKPVADGTASNAAAPTPELTILGYVGGKRVAQLTMSADLTRDHLVMTADDTVITADGIDATRVVFRGVDAHGNQRRNQTGQVELSVTGPAVLLGDNPFAFGAYGGLGGVWVRSVAGQFGEIAIAATHPTLGTARVEITAVRSGDVTPV